MQKQNIIPKKRVQMKIEGEGESYQIYKTPVVFLQSMCYTKIILFNIDFST